MFVHPFSLEGCFEAFLAEPILLCGMINFSQATLADDNDLVFPVAILQAMFVP
jgi:hypothetical protein